MLMDSVATRPSRSRTNSREDGGWGERCNTYDDPVFKGQGPSTASQSAWAVMGLCAFDDPGRPSLRRGLEYLIRTQNPDGSWTEDETTGTGFPKVFYLKYDIYRNAWPLLALATYRRIRRQDAGTSSGPVDGKSRGLPVTRGKVIPIPAAGDGQPR